MKKIRLVFNSKEDAIIACGMDLYRLAIPYSPLEVSYEVMAMSQDEFDLNDLDGDIYVMNRPLLFRAQKVKAYNKVLIVDIDDYWILPKHHGLHVDNLKAQLDFAAKNPTRVKQNEVAGVRVAYAREKDSAKNTLESAKIADIVTTTTPQLRDELAKVGINAVIVKNSIHPSLKQFTTDKERSSKIRFGWVGGVFHRRDVALMYEGMRRLHNDPTSKGKYQILSAFNYNSDYVEGEKILTNNYSCCSEEYRKYLKEYTRIGSHIGSDESYRRLWNKDVSNYGQMYESIDVALIPLQDTPFNRCKSELKLIEAGMTGCAAIVSDVLPYAPYLQHGYNCLTTDGTNGWYTAMKMLIDKPEMVKVLADNLRKTIEQNFDVMEQSNILATELNNLQCQK